MDVITKDEATELIGTGCILPKMRRRGYVATGSAAIARQVRRTTATHEGHQNACKGGSMIETRKKAC